MSSDPKGPKPTPLPQIVVGFSGGITSARCAQWALDHFPRERVTLLFHDTKEEHPDSCVRGGRAYWLKVLENDPETYAKREAQEEKFGFTIINGISLKELRTTPLKRAVNWREKFEVPCECIG